MGDKRTLTSYVKYKKRKKGVNEPLIWKTSNKKVATVSQKGVVKGKSNGKAYITLTLMKLLRNQHQVLQQFLQLQHL